MELRFIFYCSLGKEWYNYIIEGVVLKMENQYNKTIMACFVGYIVQAVVNNFTPLLFCISRKAIIFHCHRLPCL